MRKIVLALLLTMTALPAHAAWELVHSGNGAIYLENATMQVGQGFIQANLMTDYTGSINSDVVCYPSGGDCQWKKLNETTTYRFFCQQTVQLVSDKIEWDQGPVSQSYNPQTHSYDSPPPSSGTPPPSGATPGGVYNIPLTDAAMLAVEKRVCTNKF